MKINRALSIVLAALMVVAMLPAYAFASTAGTVTIAGDSGFVSAPAGTYSKLTYTATYSSGGDSVTDPTAFSWEVTEDDAPATDVWCVDGEFIVAGGASGTYNIVATHKATGIESAEFPVVVTASTLYDWSTNVPTSGAKLATTDADGNAYHAGTGSSSSDINLTNNSSNIKTVRLRVRKPSANTKTIVIEDKNWKNSLKTADVAGTTDKYNIYQNNNGKAYYICDGTGAYVQLDKDEWYEISYEFYINESKVAVRIDDVPQKFKASSGIVEQLSYDVTGTNSFRAYIDIDDAVAFSGVEYSPDLEIESVEKEIIVPQAEGSKAYIQLTASSLIYGSENITWSIPQTTGVSIDEATGLVTVTNAASAGTVKVTATQAGMTSETAITLKVVNEDFEAYDVGATPSNWFYSSVASDDASNQYHSKQSSMDYIGWYFRNVKDVAKYGSMVIEFKFKCSTKSAKAAIRRSDSSNWTDDYVNLGLPSGWTSAKMVYNNTKNANGKYTLTAFVGDEMRVYNQELAFSGDLTSVAIHADAIDDFKVYGVDFAVPEAYDVALSNTAPGSELALSYKYYNEGIVAENGTEIVWSYADAENSAEWTPLSEYDDKTSIDASTTATLKGKYVKAVVTPKCVNPYTNEAVAGTPAEAVALIDDVVLSSECTVDGSAFDIANDLLAAGKTLSYTLSANQIQETAETYMVVAATYTADGKELLSADAKELTTEKDVVKSITVSATKTGDSIIKLFVFKKADISPVIYNLIK